MTLILGCLGSASAFLLSWFTKIETKASLQQMSKDYGIAGLLLGSGNLV